MAAHVGLSRRDYIGGLSDCDLVCQHGLSGQDGVSKSQPRGYPESRLSEGLQTCLAWPPSDSFAPPFQVHSASSLLIEGLAAHHSNITTLKVTPLGGGTKAPQDEEEEEELSLDFFAALSQLPNLRELTVSRGYDNLRAPSGLLLCLAGPLNLVTLNLRNFTLGHEEVQLLAEMPGLRHVSASRMLPTSAIRAGQCSWATLELESLPYNNPNVVQYLPLKAGVQLSITLSSDWSLGLAETPADVAMTAHSVAQASAILANCLVPTSHPDFFLRWEELPSELAAQTVAQVIVALAPLAGAINWDRADNGFALPARLILEIWEVDSATLQAVASTLPGLRCIGFDACQLTSAAWLQLHEMPACSDILFCGRTSIGHTDIIPFISTIKRACSLHIYDQHDPEDEPAFDPLSNREVLLELLPGLYAHRQHVGVPPAHVFFDADLYYDL